MYQEKYTNLRAVEISDGANVLQNITLADRPHSGSVRVKGTSLIVKPFGGAGYDCIVGMGQRLKYINRRGDLETPHNTWGDAPQGEVNLFNGDTIWVLDGESRVLQLRGYSDF